MRKIFEIFHLSNAVMEVDVANVFFNFFCDRLTFHFQRSSSDLKACHGEKILVLASPTNNK